MQSEDSRMSPSVAKLAEMRARMLPADPESISRLFVQTAVKRQGFHSSPRQIALYTAASALPK